MKYIKKYEIRKYNRPRVLDYVICKEGTHLITPDYIKNFINNNIGQIVGFDKTADNQYIVKYENPPKGDEFIDDCRWFNRDEIIYYSPNKEELKLKLATKKYNL